MILMTFHDLHQRLIDEVRRRVSRGEVTVRGLAHTTGVSQPHLHNVLKGKRLLSADLADAILAQLQMDVRDLIGPDELAGFRRRA